VTIKLQQSLVVVMYILETSQAGSRERAKFQQKFMRAPKYM